MDNQLKPRLSAVRILEGVLKQKLTVDIALLKEKEYLSYSDSDRHFVKLLVLSTLRRLGQIDGVLSQFIKKKIAAKNSIVLTILRVSVAQYLFLKTPDYAVVNTAVGMVRAVHLNPLTGFVNAVLRSLIRCPNPMEKYTSPLLNLPKWLVQSWDKAYGKEATQKIAEVVLEPPPLDITVADEREEWAEKWNGIIMPTGSVRVQETNPEALSGFLSSKAWVQNAAASVPAQLFSDIVGKKVADLCAAPGGKTAQLVARGALVQAFDISEKRLVRLKENMERLGYESCVRTRVADILTLTETEEFDAVLLDAPCSATGTIARHPELKYHQTPADVRRLSELQQQLLAQAISMTRSGGEIVFSTCSLQPEEGDEVVKSVSGVDILRPSMAWCRPFMTSFGSLRFLPSDGYDGFYACLMKKK